MRNFVSGLAVALGLTACIWSAAPAQADPEADYLGAMSGILGQSVNDPPTRSAMLTMGYMECSDIQHGQSPYAALNTMGVDVAADPAIAAKLVTAATTTLCPLPGSSA